MAPLITAPKTSQPIIVEPGALAHVPLMALAEFLAEHGLQIVQVRDGLKIRRRPEVTGG